MKSKLDKFCEEKRELILSFPHVDSFGVSSDTGNKFIAIIKREIDDDSNDSWTEMEPPEEKAIRRALIPHNVRFFDSLMLNFKEWIDGTPKKKNPINETVYYRETT